MELKDLFERLQTVKMHGDSLKFQFIDILINFTYS